MRAYQNVVVNKVKYGLAHKGKVIRAKAVVKAYEGKDKEKAEKDADKALYEAYNKLGGHSFEI